MTSTIPCPTYISDTLQALSIHWTMLCWQGAHHKSAYVCLCGDWCVEENHHENHSYNGLVLILATRTMIEL